MNIEEIRKKHSAGHVTSFKYPMNVIADYNNDVRTLLSLIDRYKTGLEQARDKTQVLASHCAYAKGIGYNLDAQDTFEKSQAIYELLNDILEKE